MFHSLRILFAMALFLSVCGTQPSDALAGLIVTEVESNNRVSLRQQLPGGVMEVRGSLAESAPPVPVFSFNSVLNSGAVDFYSIPGQTAGTPFFAWTDISNSGVDTYLGTFATNGIASTLIGANDDGGVGLASALGGTVNGDGTINLGVSGFPDSTFIGDHQQQGEYDLFVTYDAPLPSDVDIFQFNDLYPGLTYIAEITSASFDTVLGLFNQGGSLEQTDDDGGVGLLSRMEIVASSPSIILGVSAYSDFSFNGDHTSSGEYVLSFQAVVPEPGSAVIWGLGCVAIIGRRRRNSSY
jgi:hypothetical protein